jgi:hypothetical protein
MYIVAIATKADTTTEANSATAVTSTAFDKREVGT